MGSLTPTGPLVIRRYAGTSLSSVRQRLVMGPGLAEAERTGGCGEEEGDAEEAASTGGDAEDADRTGGGCGEDATSTGGEEEEEEEEEGQRTGGRGSGSPDAPLTFGPTPPPPASSFFFSFSFSFSFSARGTTRGTAPRLSRAFSMLSRSALRSENQQSTSVWDSLVSRASWSAGRWALVREVCVVIT